MIRLLFPRRRGSVGIQHLQDFGHGRFESQIAEEQGWAWRLLLGLEDLLGSFGIHFRRGARCAAPWRVGARWLGSACKVVA